VLRQRRAHEAARKDENRHAKKFVVPGNWNEAKGDASPDGRSSIVSYDAKKLEDEIVTGDAINPTRKIYDELDAGFAHFNKVIGLAGPQYPAATWCSRSRTAGWWPTPRKTEP
jgi:hypothetical protein